jgi:hypothetical protein
MRGASSYALPPDLLAFVAPGDPDESVELDEEEGVLELGLVSLAGEALSPDSLLIAFLRASDG